jgi:hypothetical protein
MPRLSHTMPCFQMPLLHCFLIRAAFLDHTVERKRLTIGLPLTVEQLLPHDSKQIIGCAPEGSYRQNPWC